MFIKYIGERGITLSYILQGVDTIMKTKAIKAVNKQTGEIRYFDSVKEGSEALGVCYHTISDILCGKFYSHSKGWVFEFVEPHDKPNDKPIVRDWEKDRMNPVLMQQKIRVGAEFKNFTVMAQALGFYINLQGGKIREGYKIKFRRYFDWTTDGQKIIISEVFFDDKELEEEIAKLEND